MTTHTELDEATITTTAYWFRKLAGELKMPAVDLDTVDRRTKVSRQAAREALEALEAVLKAGR